MPALFREKPLSLAGKNSKEAMNWSLAVFPSSYTPEGPRCSLPCHKSAMQQTHSFPQRDDIIIREGRDFKGRLLLDDVCVFELIRNWWILSHANPSSKIFGNLPVPLNRKNLEEVMPWIVTSP